MTCSMLPSVAQKPFIAQLRENCIAVRFPASPAHPLLPAHCVPSTGCARVNVSPCQRCVLCNPAVSSAEDATIRVSTLPSPHSEQELGELQHRREEWQARLSEVVEGTREEDLALQIEEARWAATAGKDHCVPVSLNLPAASSSCRQQQSADWLQLSHENATSTEPRECIFN